MSKAILIRLWHSASDNRKSKIENRLGVVFSLRIRAVWSVAAGAWRVTEG